MAKPRKHDDGVETFMYGLNEYSFEPDFSYHPPVIDDDTKMVRFEPPYYQSDVDEIVKMVREYVDSVKNGKVDMIIKLSEESMIIVDGTTVETRRLTNIIFVYRNSVRIAEYPLIYPPDFLGKAIAKSLGDDVIDA